MKKVSIILLAIILFISSSVYGETALEESLKSYLLADLETGEIFEQYNIDEIVPIASISKIMSYLVIMDSVAEGKISLSDSIVIDKDTTKITGASFDLKESEIFTVNELLEAALVVSGNDATYALAKYVAGSEKGFTSWMNLKSKEIGLESASFYNSTGLPVKGQEEQNQMSTRDILKLSRHIINKYPQILDITNIRYLSSKSRGFFQRNTNPLLAIIDGVDGLKTGSTLKAGYCYVSTLNIKGQEGETQDLRLIAIVMGAKEVSNRNLKAKELVEYGINNYSNKIFLDKDMPLETLQFPKGIVTEAPIYPQIGFTKMVHKNDNIQVITSIEKKELPIAKNSTVGKAIVVEDGVTIFETDMIIKEDIRKAKWYELFQRNLIQLIEKIVKFLSRRWDIPISCGFSNLYT